MMQPVINKLVTSSNLYLLRKLHNLEGKGVGFRVSKDWVMVNYNSSVKGLRCLCFVAPFFLDFFFHRPSDSFKVRSSRPVLSRMWINSPSIRL